MIHNRMQLNRTLREIERLKHRLEGLRKKALRKELRVLQETSIRKMLRELEEQAHLFREAEQGRVSRKVLERLLAPSDPKARPRIGETMMLLRVAQGMTQEELAWRLGTRREVVARWEREDYAGYTLENLRRVFEALGCRLALRIRVAG